MPNSFNANWPRWLVASVRKFFADNVDQSKLYLYYTGQAFVDSTKKSKAEVRVDGPWIDQKGPNEYWLTCEINILIGVMIDQEDTDLIYKHCGIICQLLMERTIPVRMYGDGEDDDPDIQIGCLIQEGKEIVVSHYGAIAPDTKLSQSTVNGTFILKLRGTGNG